MYLQQTTNIELDERIQHIQRVIESQINQNTRISSTRHQKNLYDEQNFITFPRSSIIAFV